MTPSRRSWLKTLFGIILFFVLLGIAVNLFDDKQSRVVSATGGGEHIQQHDFQPGTVPDMRGRR